MGEEAKDPDAAGWVGAVDPQHRGLASFAGMKVAADEGATKVRVVRRHGISEAIS
jgi:hypothetical protein